MGNPVAFLQILKCQCITINQFNFRTMITFNTTFLTQNTAMITLNTTFLTEHCYDNVKHHLLNIEHCYDNVKHHLLNTEHCYAFGGGQWPSSCGELFSDRSEGKRFNEQRPWKYPGYCCQVRAKGRSISDSQAWQVRGKPWILKSFFISRKNWNAVSPVVKNLTCEENVHYVYKKYNI